MSIVKSVVITSLLSAVFVASASFASAGGDVSSVGSAAGGQQDGHQLRDHSRSRLNSTADMTVMQPMNKNFTMTYLQLTSAKPNVVSDAECMAFSGQTAVIDREPGATSGTLGNNIVFKNFKSGRIYMGHNFSRTMWSADFTYMRKDGKSYHTHAYGEELLVKGMNVAYGSFTNGYCEGYYKKSF